jgi:hypothetical protein
MMPLAALARGHHVIRHIRMIDHRFAPGEATGLC